MKIVNVKENNNYFEYAIHLIDEAVSDCRILDEKYFIVIHGYGSSGAGGVIKHEVLLHLTTLKKHKKIFDFVKGEEWSDSNEIVEKMKITYPELVMNSQLNGNNSGVSVVWVCK